MNFRRNSEVGATLAEFTLFLPIWITCLIGLVNLGKVGVDSTAVQLTANKTLWNSAISVTAYAPDDPLAVPTHLLPTSAATEKGATLASIAFKDGNDQTMMDVEESAAHAAGLAFGHWGEGYATAKGFRSGPAGLAYLSSKEELEDITQDPEEIMGKKSDRAYPHLLMNDQLSEQTFSSSGGIGEVIGNLVSGSGLVATTGAGIRYGDVFASEEREIKFLRGASSTTRSHIDMLVAPQPIHPAQFNTVTFGVAWLMTQTVDYYRIMPHFGKVEFGDSNGSVPEGSLEEAGGVSIPDPCAEGENQNAECQ